ncbi:MAG: ABC transporter ATP-binding protein [Verrucomicrobiota bacterium]
MATVELHNISKTFTGGLQALKNLNLTVEDGEFVVLVGPSGCGKSTALRLIAGLAEPTAGSIRIDGQSVDGRPPQQRNISMVFQNYALYPHKNVRKNLEFPLRMMKIPKGERDERVMRAARLLGLADKLDAKPKELSGGQRQRVAMGRAIVRDPLVFLMDEPLSNLDAKLRVEIRAEIAELQRNIGITTVYVTHDQVEAMTLGQRVAVLREGLLQQVAPAQELYDHPVNTFVASFIGSPRMNIFQTKLTSNDSGWCIGLGTMTLPVAKDRLRNPQSLPDNEGKTIFAGLRPEAFVPAETVAPKRRLHATLRAAEELGHEEIIYFDSPAPLCAIDAQSQRPPSEERKQTASTMVARLNPGMRPKIGEKIEFGVDPTILHLFDAEGYAL